MQQLTEGAIQKSITDYLRLKKYVVFKANSTQFGIREGKPFAFPSSQKGLADIIACSTQGRFIAVECKKPGGKASEDQLAFLEAVRANGGIGIIAFSLDD